MHVSTEIDSKQLSKLAYMVSRFHNNKAQKANHRLLLVNTFWKIELHVRCFVAV